MWKASGNHGPFEDFSGKNPKTLYFQKFLADNPGIQETINTPMPKSSLRDTGAPNNSSAGGKSTSKKKTPNSAVNETLQRMESSNRERTHANTVFRGKSVALQEVNVGLKKQKESRKNAHAKEKSRRRTRKELQETINRMGELFEKKRKTKDDLKQLQQGETQDSSIDELEFYLETLEGTIADCKHRARELKAMIAKWPEEDAEEEAAKVIEEEAAKVAEEAAKVIGEAATSKENSVNAQSSTPKARSRASNLSGRARKPTPKAATSQVAASTIKPAPPANSYTRDQIARYKKWFQTEETDLVSLKSATPIKSGDIELYVNANLHFACRVKNYGKIAGRVTTADWIEMFDHPFATQSISLEMMAHSSDISSHPHCDENIGSTFRQFAVNLVATDPKLLISWICSENSKCAYEAAVELLGRRSL